MSNIGFGSALYQKHISITPQQLSQVVIVGVIQDSGPPVESIMPCYPAGWYSPVRHTKCKISFFFLVKNQPGFQNSKASDFGVMQIILGTYTQRVANGPGLNVVRVGLVTWTVGLMCHTRWSETRAVIWHRARRQHIRRALGSIYMGLLVKM